MSVHRTLYTSLFLVVFFLAVVPARGQLGGIKGAINKAKKTVETAKPGQTGQGQQPTAGQPAKAPSAPAQQPAAQQPPASQPAPNATAQQKPFPEASTGGSVEMTNQMYSLMTLRDIPQFMDDKFIMPITSAQISTEQNVWKQLGPLEMGGNLYPAKPSITYEWQKLIDSQPDFAGGPLLDAFINNNADWSFLNNNPKWDANANAALMPVIGLFVFSKEKVEGRQSEFAARELAPVVKRMFQMAMKKLPTHFYFSEQLPLWKYDFDASAIRFNGTQEMPDKIDLMRPVYDPAIKVGVREYYEKLPAKAREMVAYAGGASGDTYGYWVAQHTMPVGSRPGKPVPGEAPEWKWKQNFIWGPIPEPTVFALDRQVRIGAIPLDVARAEQLTKLQGLLTARIFFTADHIELGNPAAPLDRATQTVLYAKLEKVQILDRNGGLVATLEPASFRVAKDVNTAVAAPAAPAKPAPPAASTAPRGETNEQRVARENKEAWERDKAKQDAAIKKMYCEGDAERAGKPDSAAYKKVYDQCMAKKP